MPRGSSTDVVLLGDLIVTSVDGGMFPPFVVRCGPGPDQFGCATLAAATRLARAFAATSGVDVWLADRTGRVTPVARFRGLGRSAAPPARVAAAGMRRPAETGEQNGAARPARLVYDGGAVPA